MNTNSFLVSSFNGVVSAESSERFKTLLEEAASHSEVILDFSDVARVNSTGISAMLKALRDLHTQGKPVSIRGANHMTQMLFKMTGVQKFAQVVREHV